MPHNYLALATLLWLALNSGLAASVPRDGSPIITQPNSLTEWTLGVVQTVTWTTGGLDLDGMTGTVVMGFAFTNGTIQLWKDQPLATNVPLADGIVSVRCPANVPTSFRYVVALLGGKINNISPPLIILDINNHEFGSIVDISTLPAVLSAVTSSTQSATITHTSVVATIPAASITTGASGTSGEAQATETQKPSGGTNGAQSWRGGAWPDIASLLMTPGMTIFTSVNRSRSGRERPR